ncbi:MAG: hypothetical protein GY839_09595 [candidate division Zixibacteria bacterium]|nr:hypothetical protein [candidate division Zixibacteria bacterium]
MKKIVILLVIAFSLVLVRSSTKATDMSKSKKEFENANKLKSYGAPDLITDYADTIEGGAVSGIWTFDASPIFVADSIWISPGDTLIILPNIDTLEFKFADGATFEVLDDAVLRINVDFENEYYDNIVVLRDAPPYQWKGLKFTDASSSSIVYNTDITGSSESGIEAVSSDISISNCFIHSNGSNNLNRGGGISSWNSNININGCLIRENEAESAGGLYFQQTPGEIISVTDNIIFKNIASENHGGGIEFNNVSDCLFSRNLVLGNVADNLGGGLYFNASSFIIEKNTIAYNTAVSAGAGVYFGNGSQPTLANNILWFDEITYSGVIQEIGIEQGNPDPTFLYCCIQDTLIQDDDSTNISENPWEDDPDSDDSSGASFYLKWRGTQSNTLFKSVCIDRGDPLSSVDPDGSRPDIGAYPHFHPFHLLGTIVSDSTLPDSFGPYYLVAPCTVTDSSTLTIEPGTEIKAWYSAFAEDSITLVDLVIENGAVLNADGASFGCDDSVDAWKGIVLNNAGPDCSLQNVNIENADSTALAVTGSAVTIINSTFQNNSGANGGAISSFNAALKCSLSDFSSNTAEYGASIYIDSDSAGVDPVMIYENNFLGGSATADGGAIYIGTLGGSLNAEIVRNVFKGNTSGNNGGAISCNAFTPNDKTKFTNNTFYENIAGQLGGAVYASANSFFDIKNSIFWNNLAFDSQSRHVFVPHDSVTYTYCDISLDIWTLDEDDSTNFHDYPLFQDTLGGDFSLMQNSPCIQRGDPDSLYNDPDGTRSDIGGKYFSQGNNILPDPIDSIVSIASDDSVIVESDFTVHAGETLDIDSGALFNFLNGAKLIIEDGGIIQCSLSVVDLADENDPYWVTFTSFDTATGWGGLVFDEVSTHSLKHVLFKHAKSSAISLISCASTAVVDSCRFQYNNGNPGPGAILVDGGEPTITSNYFWRNSSRGNGGAVRITGATEATVYRNIFWQNDAFGSGGGMACDSAGVEIEIANNTFFENRANAAGALSINNNTPKVIQNIMWDDTAHFNPELYIAGGELDSVTYCDIEGGWDPETLHNLNVYPGFSDTSIGDFSLAGYSSLINAGDTSYHFDEDGSVADIGAIFYDHRLDVEAQIPDGYPDTLLFPDGKIIVNYYENLDSLLIVHYNEFAPRYFPDTLIPNIQSYFAVFAYPDDDSIDLDLILSYRETDLNAVGILNDNNLEIIRTELDPVEWLDYTESLTVVDPVANTITAQHVTNLSLWSIKGELIDSAKYDYLPGDVNMYNGIWPPSVIGGDVTYLVNYFRNTGTSVACRFDDTLWCSADANGDCMIIGSDVTKLVTFFRGDTEISYCQNFNPKWPTPGDLPPEAPANWPDCDSTEVLRTMPIGAVGK